MFWAAPGLKVVNNRWGISAALYFDYKNEEIITVVFSAVATLFAVNTYYQDYYCNRLDLCNNSFSDLWNAYSLIKYI